MSLFVLQRGPPLAIAALGVDARIGGVMRDLSRANPGIRRFPEFTSAVSHRRGLGVVGSPHESLDLLSKILIWGATLLMVVALLGVSGGTAWPLVLVGTPIFLGVPFLIARMGGRGWQRITGLLYVGVVFLAVGHLLGYTN